VCACITSSRRCIILNMTLGVGSPPSGSGESARAIERESKSERARESARASERERECARARASEQANESE
jgi:hypothetical protein